MVGCKVVRENQRKYRTGIGAIIIINSTPNRRSDVSPNISAAVLSNTALFPTWRSDRMLGPSLCDCEMRKISERRRIPIRDAIYAPPNGASSTLVTLCHVVKQNGRKFRTVIPRLSDVISPTHRPVL